MFRKIVVIVFVVLSVSLSATEREDFVRENSGKLAVAFSRVCFAMQSESTHSNVSVSCVRAWEKNLLFANQCERTFFCLLEELNKALLRNKCISELRQVFLFSEEWRKSLLRYRLGDRKLCLSIAVAEVEHIVGRSFLALLSQDQSSACALIMALYGQVITPLYSGKRESQMLTGLFAHLLFIQKFVFKLREFDKNEALLEKKLTPISQNGERRSRSHSY